MNFSFSRRMAAHLMVWTSVFLLTLGLNGCGGDGGSDDDIGPAPLTMNGLVMTLYTSGVELTFVRSEGNATSGVETGSVTMKERPQSTPVVDSSGGPSSLQPSNSISGARYSYTRSTQESGSITITGSASGVFNSNFFFDGIFINFPIANIANYFRGPLTPFSRTYTVLFGTDGATISGIDVNDTGEGFTLFWNDATLKVFGAGAVPNAWSLDNSVSVVLPKLYPTGLSGQELVVTPDNPAESVISYSFLTSTFTRFSDSRGDFVEEGVGNSVDVLGTRSIINYNYQPDATTTNKAIIRIFNPTGPAFIYNMTFLDLETGNYVREDGSSGTFNFPFLR